MIGNSNVGGSSINALTEYAKVADGESIKKGDFVNLDYEYPTEVKNSGEEIEIYVRKEK